MLVLDTDHFSLIEKPNNRESLRLRHRLEQAVDEQCATTIVSYEEQSRGWLAYTARARSKTEQIDAYCRLFRHLDAYRKIMVLEFDSTAFDQYQSLKRIVSIGTMDLKIAAITLAHDALLLSRNFKDFGQVPGLKVEDWLS
jgi:tRNA(fMet)-specific endonuclease VapC